MASAADHPGTADRASISHCEVPFEPVEVSQSISVPAPSDAAAPAADWPAPADRGGCVYLWQQNASAGGGAADECGFSWAISAADADTVVLHEWSLDGTGPSTAVRLTFAAPLLPAVAVWAGDTSAVLYFLTADAALHAVSLQQRPAGGGQSLLAALAAAGLAAVDSATIPDAAALGAPTALAAVSGAVAVGGSAGGVRCVPQACLAGKLPIQDTVQLAASGDGLVTRLARGFWGAVQAPAVIDLAAAPFLGPHMLAALYANASVRFWDTKAAAPTVVVASLAALAPGGGAFARGAPPQRLRLAAAGVPRQALLAVQLGGGDGGAKSAVELFTVHFEGRTAGLQHTASLQV